MKLTVTVDYETDRSHNPANWMVFLRVDGEILAHTGPYSHSADAEKAADLMREKLGLLRLFRFAYPGGKTDIRAPHMERALLDFIRLDTKEGGELVALHDMRELVIKLVEGE